MASNKLQAEPTEPEFIGSDKNYPIGEIGPKSQVGMGPVIEDSAFIMGKYPFTVASVGSKEFYAFAHSRRIFLWGWVGYRDVFPKTMPHVTEFCEEMRGIGAGFKAGITGTEDFFQGMYGTQLHRRTLQRLPSHCSDGP